MRQMLREDFVAKSAARIGYLVLKTANGVPEFSINSFQRAGANPISEETPVCHRDDGNNTLLK